MAELSDYQTDQLRRLVEHLEAHPYDRDQGGLTVSFSIYDDVPKVWLELEALGYVTVGRDSLTCVRPTALAEEVLR